MFSYLKLFLISALLCNFLLLLPDQVFFNQFSNTSVNPNLVSKYSFVKLKSGFARPLTQALGRRTFGAGFQSPRTTGLRCGPGSSEGVARAINKALGTSPNSGAKSTSSSSAAVSGTVSSGSRGSTSTGSGIFPGNPVPTQGPRTRNLALQSQNRSSHSSTQSRPIPSCYSPGSRPLTKPVGYVSSKCPTNPNSQHYMRPGAGRRMHCQHCD